MTQTKCKNCLYSQTQKQIGQNLEHNISGKNELNAIYIKCIKCQIVNCKSCFKQHFEANHSVSEVIKKQSEQKNCQIICQQCQEDNSRKFCQNCQQHLCNKCSFKIHNKGKRAKHQLLSNDTLIKIEKLFFSNSSETQKDFQFFSKEFSPERSLIVHGPKRPEYIEAYQSLQTEDINNLTIEEIQSCLNRYPLISFFSVNQKDSKLVNLLVSLSIEEEPFDFQEDEHTIYLCGFKINLFIRKIMKDKTASKKTKLNQEDCEKSQEKSCENDNQTMVLKNNSAIQCDRNNQAHKKQTIDFSCSSKEDGEPIPDMPQLFKKSLKMSNRSLIIEISQTNQYKQSPIKSDREQGFIERNSNLLQNAQKKYKLKNSNTLQLLDNDIMSQPKTNLQEQSSCKSNDESILMIGNLQDQQEDNSFRLIGNEQQFSDLGNSADQNDNQVNAFSLVNLGNTSLSTENSLHKKSKKLPIPYFHPMKSKSIDNLNNSSGYLFTEKTRYMLEKKFRELAETGLLMISRKQLQQFNFKFDDKIIKKMKKNVCDEELQYYSLKLEIISIESICWVLQSIKQDRMMPFQKLVLSRLKQCFNIKPAQKVWIYILKYLDSSQYFADKEGYDRIKVLPSIFVKKWNEQILLEYQPKWAYEDQQEPLTTLEQWQVFKIFLNEYFKKNKQITGGRYGCVQYVKLNGPQKLKMCSLGRLSYFVQEAINKGLIRYHKTLLIQNYESFEKSVHLEKNSVQLFDLQKELKIMTVQVALIDIFLEAGLQSEVSLAQIPLTFKKTILFDVNLLELGFPKLKNILHTLTDKLILSSSKSHIKYQQIRSNKKIQELRIKLQQTMQYFISQMSEIISLCMSNRYNIIAQELYNLANEKLGFIFDFKVCNVPDFYQFLIYYCHQAINLQFINGTFVAFQKHMGYMAYQYPNNQSLYSQGYQYGSGPFYQAQNPYINSLNQHPANLNFYSAMPQAGRHGTYHQFYNLNGNETKNQFNYGNEIKNNGTQSNAIFQSSSTSKHNDNPKVLKVNEQKMHFCVSSKNYQPILPEAMTYTPSTQISTPKFNESIEYINKKTNKNNFKNLQNFQWGLQLEIISNCEDQEDKINNFESQSFTDYQSIYNILDDDKSQEKSKISNPKTFIQNQSICNNKQGELCISKITPICEKSNCDEQEDASLNLFEESSAKKQKKLDCSTNYRNSKKAHNRARTKHERVFSTTTAKN